ncbi:hypothetical protein NBRC111893_233 [Lentilactobacillus kosonis]|uniref:Uncharacterized protein n=1 Tax=Lentilactobacillus kosonis TaxID=2810561 RepID=A0A401FIC7_9LACO|nr:hypothetical protein NBRC111893_233 [Lentilactobacillus kosonis]
MLYDALRSEKVLHKFTKADGAEEHCQMGALGFFNQQVFTWLDQIINSNN